MAYLMVVEGVRLQRVVVLLDASDHVLDHRLVFGQLEACHAKVDQFKYGWPIERWC